MYIMLNSHNSLAARIIDRLIIRTSHSEVVDGLWIGAFTDKKGLEPLAHVRAALALIRGYDKHRYKRVRRRLDKILVQLCPSRGRYVPELRRCVIDADFVEKGEIAQIASTIVHEATHAELFARGVSYETSIRARVEAICSKQEMLFAKKLPHPDAALLDRIQAKLALPAETWQDASSFEREREWLRVGGTFGCLLSKLVPKSR